MKKTNDKQKNDNEKEIVYLMHDIITASFCYNPNDESINKRKNVYTRPTDKPA